MQVITFGHTWSTAMQKRTWGLFCELQDSCEFWNVLHISTFSFLFWQPCNQQILYKWILYLCSQSTFFLGVHYIMKIGRWEKVISTAESLMRSSWTWILCYKYSIVYELLIMIVEMEAREQLRFLIMCHCWILYFVCIVLSTWWFHLIQLSWDTTQCKCCHKFFLFNSWDVRQ